MCLFEVLVSLGTSILVLVVMPQFDVLTNLFNTGGVCFLSAFLQILFRLQKESWKIIFPICSLFLVLTGYVLLALDYYVRVKTYVDGQQYICYVYVGIALFASLLVSLNWWENPLQASRSIQELLTELDGFRDFVFAVSSLLRIVVIGAVYSIHAHFIESCDWTYFSHVPQDALNVGIGIFCLQAFSSALCHWFGVVACKIHAVQLSFALPLSCTGPTVLILGMVLFLTKANELEGYSAGNFTTFCSSVLNIQDKNTTQALLAEISRSICRTTLNSHWDSWPFAMLALEGICMWLGLMTATYYVWKIKVPRIERTSQLFVRRLYESAFIDQSMLLNTKMKAARGRNLERQVTSIDCTPQKNHFN